MELDPRNDGAWLAVCWLLNDSMRGAFATRWDAHVASAGIGPTEEARQLDRAYFALTAPEVQRILYPPPAPSAAPPKR